MLKLAKEGASNIRHFSYHKRILKELRSYDKYLEQKLPDNLNDFAFYTEVAFCPSSKQKDIPGPVLVHCFEKNVKSFIIESGFEIIITVGQIPTLICLGSLLDIEYKPSHAEVIFAKGFGKYIIASKHPNAFGFWDRSAVSKSIYQLYKEKK